ncbi:MAG: transposase [Zoogloea sp.]|nr:transposase [Zoogloea sp.]
MTPGDRAVLGATALADPGRWHELAQRAWIACCLGLAPGHRGTGGKVRIGRISKRGNAYLRTLAGSTAPALWPAASTRPRGSWRCWGGAFNVVVVAIAHVGTHRVVFGGAWAGLHEAS